MEIVLIICVVCLGISFIALLFMFLQMNEEFKFLTHKVNEIETKTSKDYGYQENIDYENLKQEL